MVLLVSCVISELIAITFIAFFFKESDEIINVVDSRNENDLGLIKAVQALSMGLQTFLSSGLLIGKKTMFKAFKELEDSLSIHLKDRPDIVINAIYQRLQVKETLAIQNEVMHYLAALQKDSTELNKKVAVVSNFLADLASAEVSLARTLKKECNPIEQCKTAIELLNASTLSLTSIPTEKSLVTESVTALQNFKVELDPWFLLVPNLNQSLAHMKVQLSNPSSSLTIDLSPNVEVVWRQVELQVNSLIRTIQGLEQEVVSSLNKTTRTSVTAAISSVGGVLVCLLLLMGVFVIGFVQIIVKERCLQKPRKFRKDISACRSSIFILCSFLVVIAVLLTVLIVCTTFGSSLFYTEGCVYLKEDKHLAIFDAVLSGYMQSIWEQISGEAIFGLPPPRHLLSAAIHECRESGASLFVLIGWHSFPDLLTLLHSENVQGVIQDGRYELMEILQAEQNGLVSADAGSYVNSSLSRLIMTLDEVQRVIREITLRKLDFERTKEVLEKLQALRSLVPSLEGPGDIFTELCHRVPEMQRTLEEIDSTTNTYIISSQLAKRFLLNIINIATVSPYTNGRRCDLRNSSVLDNLLSDVYTNTTWHLCHLCTPLMRSLVERLFPCNGLPVHFLNLIDTVCGREGLLARVYAWGVVVWIEMSLLFLLHLPLLLGIAVVRKVLAKANA
ncbi:unnamed protein product [Hydatigera taeniaeformis]|uniref:ANK_REP_REGION domain-containing protein n=1 Tax=Hydatigena taeniaeformis TaxID=6205 RepID=A0A0R3WPM1_HYDTA|nr:unnamed protein product [Hydatigera taeniaeformis]